MKCTSVLSKPNRHRNKLFLGEKNEYEVPDENNNGIEMDESKTEKPTELVTERDFIRRKARMRLIRQYMVMREIKPNPLSLYYKGETVLI